MMNLTLPLNFGERPCDRMLLALLRPRKAESVLWSAFLIWKDFGIARDDRRSVPCLAEERRVCPAVAIIEQFCGWAGDPGELVESAIQAGFFLLVAVGGELAELVLVDFFPANQAVDQRGFTGSR